MQATKTVQKLLRSAQVHFPSLVDAKASGQATVRRVLHRPHERDFVLFRHLQIRSPLVLDVGANRGQSISSFSVTCVEPRIVAFEPLPHLARRLQTRLDPSGVRIEPCALGAAPSHMTMYLPVYNGYVFDGLASLDRAEAQWLNEDRIFHFKPERLVLHEIEVEVKTLDSFELEPDIVKIDVQGTEKSVVDGAGATIDAARPIFLVECPSGDLIGLFAGKGYDHFAYVHGRLRRGAVGDPNTLFIPEHRLRQFPKDVLGGP